MYWLDPNLRYAKREADIMVSDVGLNNFQIALHAPVVFTTRGLSIIVMRLSALLSAGICCELPCHHLGEDPEPF